MSDRSIKSNMIQALDQQDQNEFIPTFIAKETNINAEEDDLTFIQHVKHLARVLEDQEQISLAKIQQIMSEATAKLEQEFKKHKE